MIRVFDIRRHLTVVTEDGKAEYVAGMPGQWTGPVEDGKGVMPFRVRLLKVVVGVLILALAYYVISRIELDVILHH